MSYLVDTNVVSEGRRQHGNAGVKRWLASAEQEQVYVSVLVVGEIRRGIERIRRRDPVQAAILAGWYVEFIESYAGRILPVTHEIAELWGEMDAAGPYPIVDGLLAATAMVHGLAVVTRNLVDFERTGVACLNPFEPR